MTVLGFETQIKNPSMDSRRFVVVGCDQTSTTQRSSNIHFDLSVCRHAPERAMSILDL